MPSSLNGTGVTFNDATTLQSGNIPAANLGSGTANSTTFLRGDKTWATPGGAPTVVNTFNANGTWTKPSTGSMARIQMWGGGGGGGRAGNPAQASGGGGGGYNEITVPLSTLGATVTVTVGAGGAGRTGSTGFGVAGGTSSFGTLLSAFGGGGGHGAGVGISIISSGGGGGQLSTGSNGVPTVTLNTQLTGRPFAGGRGGYASFMWHGGTAMADLGGYASLNIVGDSVFGGGAGSYNQMAQGLSVYGGNGGAAFSTVPSQGVGAAPGGGGGASSSNANIDGANGAAGRVIVTVW
jgi:hypothetical protein